MPGTIALHVLVLYVLMTLPHEIGHYVAARLLDVPVQEVGLGLPPTIVAVPWRGTRWSLNLVPIGAFLRHDSVDACASPGWAACAIAIGGPVANILVGIVCVLLLLSPSSASLVDLGRNLVSLVTLGLSLHWSVNDVVSLATLTPTNPGASLGSWTDGADFLRLAISASIVFGVTNLIPIPPLDGSKVLFGSLSAIGLRLSKRPVALLVETHGDQAVRAGLRRGQRLSRTRSRQG